jgi:HTTM domain
VSPAAAIARRWNDFWFREGPVLPLAIFRTLFAVALWIEVDTGRALNRMAVLGGFHLPYAFSPPLLSASAYDAFHSAELPLVALIGLGIWARPACAALLLLQGWVFFADQLGFRNHPYLFLWILGFLCLAPRDALSSRRLWRARGRSLAPHTVQRLLQVQVSGVYACAGLHKWNPTFLGGYTLASLVTEHLDAGVSGWLGAHLLAPATWQAWKLAIAAPDSWVVASIAAAGLELALAAGLWLPATRRLAFAAGLAFHLAIAVALDVFAFSLAMLASYVLWSRRYWR